MKPEARNRFPVQSDSAPSQKEKIEEGMNEKKMSSPNSREGKSVSDDSG